MNKNIPFSYLGGPGGPYVEPQMNENFRAVRPHHRAEKSERTFQGSKTSSQSRKK